MTDDELLAAIDQPALRAELSATELTSAFLDRIETEELDAFITVTRELALAGARAADEARGRGAPLELDGMPIAIKDNVDVAGVRCTVGSRLFADRVAAEDAPVVRRLGDAGAVILGKTNLHELAFGATSANEAFGAVVNPWGPIIPGGSSGGSGAAVAADLCIAAIGTDTGGSIRLPASLCGVSGIRPTSGLVSNEGVYPVSWTLDTVGPLARSAGDLAALLAVLAEEDLDDTPDGLGRLRIGVARGYFEQGVDPEVAGPVRDATATLSDLGAELSQVELAGASGAVEACGHLIKSEALAGNREHLRARPDELEAGTRARLALADGLSAVDLALAQREMREWQSRLRAAFETVDVLLTPTIPVLPPPSAGADAIATTAAVVPFTHAFSFARIPSLSLPCGFTRDGYPVGVQLAAPPWRDRLLLGVAGAYQAVTDWHRRRPTPQPVP